MEKVYTIETVAEQNFCIGAFVNFNKAKEYFEKAKTFVGQRDAPVEELTEARRLLLLAWQEDKYEIVEDWGKP